MNALKNGYYRNLNALLAEIRFVDCLLLQKIVLFSYYNKEA
jgi:hypothetical protein